MQVRLWYETGSKFFLFRVDPFSEVRQNNFYSKLPWISLWHFWINLFCVYADNLNGMGYQQNMAWDISRAWHWISTEYDVEYQHNTAWDISRTWHGIYGISAGDISGIWYGISAEYEMGYQRNMAWNTSRTCHGASAEDSMGYKQNMAWDISWTLHEIYGMGHQQNVTWDISGMWQGISADFDIWYQRNMTWNMSRIWHMISAEHGMVILAEYGTGYHHAMVLFLLFVALCSFVVTALHFLYVLWC